MNLTLLPETMSVLKLDASQSIPKWALENRNFVSITYTKEELSIVCEQSQVPSGDENLQTSDDWKCIKVEGPLDFSLTGILSSLTLPLAEAKISIFAISTYDTDYLLVKSDTLAQTIKILLEQGHMFN